MTIKDKSAIELVHALIYHALIRDVRATRIQVYRNEIERRIGKDFLDISVEDLTRLLRIDLDGVATVFDHDGISEFKLEATLDPKSIMFQPDGSFKPFPREDFSVPGAWVIAKAILSTNWEGCYTKTQTPQESLGTLRRVLNATLVGEDDFDSHGHANLFRVIVGEFNKWASKNLAR